MLKIANKANWPTKPCGSFLDKFPAGLPFLTEKFSPKPVIFVNLSTA